MTPKTKKAERNAKREEFTRAALLYCSVVMERGREDYSLTTLDRMTASHTAMLKAYRAMEEK